MYMTHRMLVLLLLGLLGAPARGESPYAKWSHGPSPDPSFFPIAVWLQEPALARRYKAAGFNLYLALWRGPTEKQLSQLKEAGMPVICEQNEAGLHHLDDPTIIGWMQQDEPDNAQEIRDASGRKTYGAPVKPARIIELYRKMRAADPTRPVYLGLGQGVANDHWNGRGSQGKPEDYPQYVKGGDIVSYDVYPVATLPQGGDQLSIVARGVDRLMNWTSGSRIVWNVIECTNSHGRGKATPAQVKAEVWMSIIHGSRGIVYFVHQIGPKFNEHALLDDPAMLAAVTAINRQVRDLAPVLNSGAVFGGARVRATSNALAPIECMMRRHDGATYVFAVGMRNVPGAGAFSVAGLPPHATAEVIGEDRSIPVEGGQFQDKFQPHDVHLYRIK
jgi:hypothetical protein